MNVQVQTRIFGVIEPDESAVINFPEGLYGFEGLRRFVLIDVEPDSPCRWMQSLDDGDISFVVFDPWAVLPDYTPRVPRVELVRLGLESPEEAVYLVIAVVPEDMGQMTVNLRAPLVINPGTREARQVILPGDRYSIKHRVFDTPSTAEGGEAKAAGGAEGEVSAAVAS